MVAAMDHGEGSSPRRAIPKWLRTTLWFVAVQALWDQTVNIAVTEGILQAAPSSDAFTRDLVEKVLEDLEEEGLDINGNNWQRRTVTLHPGGN